MKLTIFHNGQFWVGVVEEIDDGKLRAGRYIFGAEPKEQDILDFVHRKLSDLTNALSEEVDAENRRARITNPKRLARLAGRETKPNGISTFAQEALRLEHEKRKKERQIISRSRREEIKEYKRDLKLKKAKEKHRGR